MAATQRSTLCFSRLLADWNTYTPIFSGEPQPFISLASSYRFDHGLDVSAPIPSGQTHPNTPLLSLNTVGRRQWRRHRGDEERGRQEGRKERES
ncbi:hypothetical protein Hanom_Chr09g00838981 [Helianthus anomalus]